MQSPKACGGTSHVCVKSKCLWDTISWKSCHQVPFALFLPSQWKHGRSPRTVIKLNFKSPKYVSPSFSCVKDNRFYSNIKYFKEQNRKKKVINWTIFLSWTACSSNTWPPETFFTPALSQHTALKVTTNSTAIAPWKKQLFFKQEKMQLAAWIETLVSAALQIYKASCSTEQITPHRPYVLILYYI